MKKFILLLVFLLALSPLAQATQNPIVVNDGSGYQVRMGFNNALQSLVTLFAGTTAPNPLYPYQIWINTTTNQVMQANANATSSDVLGTLAGDGTILWNNFSGATFSGQITSTVASGTAPFVITSNTVVPNLNAQYLNGNAASYFLPAPSSPVQGDIMYYNGTFWVVLAPGTSGYYLQTQGASANPIWSASAILPGSPVQGDIVYYNGSAWTNLIPGTSGQVLQTQGASANPAWSSGPQPFRNKLINGDMRIAQRGTTGALTTAPTYISVDRFFGYEATTATGILAQSAIGPAGFQDCLKLGRNSSATSTGILYAGQEIESVNCIPLQGQTVTLSFYAKEGANYSGGSLTSAIITGTGTDQGTASISTWTGYATNTQANTLTTSWQRFTETVTLPAGETEIAYEFYYTPSGTAGADDNIYVTGVQLEQSSVATPFEVLPIQTELALCQRYFLSMTVWVGQTTSYYTSYTFPSTMRATPTVTGGGSGYTAGITNAFGFAAYQTTGAAQVMTFTAEL
jgi:Tfp pilus assembly protein PilV